MLTLEQMKANRKLWIEALRSGKYKQGYSVLRSKDDRFCCLGVLCDIAGLEWHDRGSEYSIDDDDEGFRTGVCPEKAKAFVGLVSEIGDYVDPVGGERCLTDDNDNRGAHFAAIADIIESEPEGLFNNPEAA